MSVSPYFAILIGLMFFVTIALLVRRVSNLEIDNASTRKITHDAIQNMRQSLRAVHLRLDEPKIVNKFYGVKKKKTTKVHTLRFEAHKGGGTASKSAIEAFEEANKIAKKISDIRDVPCVHDFGDGI